MVAASAVSGDAEASRALAGARREVASAAGNLEESFERLVGEHRGPAIALKPVMTLMTYTRRFAFSVGALALGTDERLRPPRDALRPFAAAAAHVLDDLAGAITEGRAPAPFPQPGNIARAESPLAPAVAAHVERLARQLKPLHDAVAEMATSNAPTAMMVAPSATR